MDEVIEASADGGFDIPTTPNAEPPSRLKNHPSKEDSVQPKPRRIRIQLEDDEEDEDEDEDDDESNNDGERNLRASTATAVTNAGRGKGLGSPVVHRPKYKIYKVETPNEDPVLEVVVSLSAEGTAAPISTTASHLGATGPPRSPSCPSVDISSDGDSIVVEHNPAAEGDSGGRDGVPGVRGGRFKLNLPQKVVPRTALSFYWEGDLTIRAALAGVE